MVHFELKKELPLRRGVGDGGLLAGKRRRPAAEDGVPPSLQIPPHATHTYCSLARLPPTHPFLLGAPTAFSNGIFRSDGAPCARPLLPSSSAGQRNQSSHSTVQARPVCLFVCVSAASFPCARLLFPSSDQLTTRLTIILEHA